VEEGGRKEKEAVHERNGLEVGGGMEMGLAMERHVGCVPKYQGRKNNKIRQLWFCL